jgi:P-type Cu+ transporter
VNHAHLFPILNTPASPLVRDVVCGMEFPASQAAGQCEYQGQAFYFCHPRCREKFLLQPECYLDPNYVPGAAAMQADLPSDTEYFCPMCPTVRQVGPGICPLCGMALEADLADAPHATEDPELQTMQWRLLWSGMLSLPVVVLAMGPMLLPSLWPKSLQHGWPSVQLLLSLAVVLIGGRFIWQRAWLALQHAAANMFSLIAIGMAAALLWSIVGTLMPHWFPDELRDQHGHVHLYYESACVITVLVIVGQVLELRARHSTQAAVRALCEQTAKEARRLLADDREELVPVNALVVGDRIRLLPGDKVPVDGRVIIGRSQIDAALLTGESQPQLKQVGDHLAAGTLNLDGTLVMQAEHVGRATLLAQIIQLVSQAQRSRAPIQATVDRVASWFVPAVVLIAVVTCVAWLLWGPEPRWSYALSCSIAVLLIACPCALGLATPMSLTVGLGEAARQGILIKDARVLEQLAQVDLLFCDKTGTLTVGRPVLQEITPFEGHSSAEILRLSASLEQTSQHPYALALQHAATEQVLTLDAVTDFQELAGQGVRGLIAGQLYTLGKPTSPVTVPAPNEFATPLCLQQGEHTLGILWLADQVKPAAREAVQALHQQGIRVVMLTGDQQSVALAIARQLQIPTDQVHAEQLPADKYRHVQQSQAQGHIVAMAGDGINDGPALALANVGIAMGNGTAVALEAAPVAIVNGDLAGIVRARQLSVATLRNIRQNLWLAMLYNGLSIPLAAGLFYPWTGWLLHPLVAAAAMSLSSLGVIGNALRLRRRSY